MQNIFISSWIDADGLWFESMHMHIWTEQIQKGVCNHESGF